MRAAVALVGFVGLAGVAGCRQVLGIEDPPEGPGSTAAATTGLAAGGGATTDAASTGGPGTGGATPTSTGAGGGGDGGGGGAPCDACGAVTCCLTSCDDGVCAATAWDVGGTARRLVDAGDHVAVVVLDGSSVDVQWAPVDARGVLPPRCSAIASDGNGRGYLTSRDGAVFYSAHSPLAPADPGAGGHIRRVDPGCVVSPVAQSTAFAGVHAGPDGLLAVVRGPLGRGLAEVRCITYDGDGICTGLTVQHPISDAFAIAVDGTRILWTALDPDSVPILLGDGSPLPLLTQGAPVDLAIPSPGQRWALGVTGDVADLTDPATSVLCSFTVEDALGFDVDDTRVYLPHADGLAICDRDLGRCALDARGPVHDVVTTPTAVFYATSTELVRVQKPLDAYVEALPEIEPCL